MRPFGVSFASLPQKDANGDRTSREHLQFQQGLALMAELYASARFTTVIRLISMPESDDPAVKYNMRPIDERGWCVFEAYVAQIIVGLHAEMNELQGLPKLIDLKAPGSEEGDCTFPQLERAPLPEEFERRLEKAEFTSNKTDQE